MPKGRYYKKTNQYNVKVGGAVDLRKRQARLNADVKYLRTLINSEMHYHYVTTSNNIDSNGQIISLCDIPQGDTLANRTGTSSLPRYQTVHMNVNKKITAAGTVDHETVRVILFRYWGESSSAAPSVTVTEILRSANPRSHLNDDNTGSKGDRERRIEVHKSKMFTLDSVGKTSMTYKWNVQVNGPNVKNKEHLKFRSSLTEQPISGGFYLLIISDNATGANKGAFYLDAKCNFYDN